MEAKGEDIMDFSESEGAPMAVAIILLLAVVALGGITFAFSGSIHF
jgi:hypothetical protein